MFGWAMRGVARLRAGPALGARYITDIGSPPRPALTRSPPSGDQLQSGDRLNGYLRLIAFPSIDQSMINSNFKTEQKDIRVQSLIICHGKAVVDIASVRWWIGEQLQIRSITISNTTAQVVYSIEVAGPRVRPRAAAAPSDLILLGCYSDSRLNNSSGAVGKLFIMRTHYPAGSGPSSRRRRRYQYFTPVTELLSGLT
ncbi:hypothetical protein EVAR_4469_1 [Eumeta japonica]|uniref:Uncharacterized protein n=1 Tax=Eumeta variegata TaxID=151549 RepID=A0A4C1SXS2_EUMVA|nr:hypothetical protein EVAR_4469_1 [Eumeta japonica]